MINPIKEKNERKMIPSGQQPYWPDDNSQHVLLSGQEFPSRIIKYIFLWIFMSLFNKAEPGHGTEVIESCRIFNGTPG